MLVYYGPTMGKTHASIKNSNLVDFDSLIRTDMELAASMMGMSTRDFKKSGHVVYDVILQHWLEKANKIYPEKIVMVSNAGALKYSKMFNGMFIPSRDVFIERNIKRGGTRQDSECLYDDIMNKHNGKNLLTIEDRFVSEILK